MIDLNDLREVSNHGYQIGDEAADYIVQLEKELAGVSASAHAHNEARIAFQQRATLAESRLAAAEEDARRYRWLRDKSVPPHNFYLSVPIEFKDERYTPEQVDAAIDAALRSAEGGKDD